MLVSVQAFLVASIDDHFLPVGGLKCNDETYKTGDFLLNLTENAVKIF